MTSTSLTPFERSSKRRRGFPSETRVKRGLRIINGDKELIEKLGRNDLCPCGSGRRFQTMLYEVWALRWHCPKLLLSENRKGSDYSLPFCFVIRCVHVYGAPHLPAGETDGE